ncbi:MAG: redoxin domain-containing protein [Marinifilaceae bacterium]
MKKILFFALALALTSVSCRQSEHDIHGKFDNTQNDTLLVQSYVPGIQESAMYDTVVMRGGHFAISFPDTSIRFVYVMEKPTIKNGIEQPVRMANEPIVFIPGNRLRVKGNSYSYKVTGSKFYDEYNKSHRKYQKVEEKLQQAEENLIAQYHNGASRQTIQQVYQQEIVPLQDSIVKIKEQFIKDHPDMILAGYYFLQLLVEDIGTYYPLLGKDVINGVFAEQIKMVHEEFQSQMAKVVAKEKLQPGMPAPDFTLPDINGKDFTLSSLYGQGKFIILDFWGEWCGWCIKGIPEMKAYYAKYQNKLQIVGIDCGDTMDKWKQSVTDRKLPWINVYNGYNPTVTNIYAVDGFPTKVIIDANGNLVHIFVGETPQFYEMLDQLLGGK